MSDNLEEIIARMHTALAKELLERIESGKARPMDLNVARAFLKDNLVINPNPREGDPLAKLRKRLPFSDEELDRALNTPA